MIRATLVYLFVGLYILLVAPFAMLWTLAARNSRLLFQMARFCIRAAGWIGGIRVAAEGLEKILSGQNYVFLSNHQGNFDAPVLYHLIPYDCSALIKKEMMRLPILSLVMKQVQLVPIERHNPKKAQLGIDLGAERLRKGRSFIAFPEGTRSRDGRLGEFKKGVFIMAIKAHAPVIPITILDSRKIQRPGEFRMRPGTIHVIFHDPISTAGMDLEDRSTLVQLTRNAIASKLPA